MTIHSILLLALTSISQVLGNVMVAPRTEVWTNDAAPNTYSLSCQTGSDYMWFKDGNAVASNIGGQDTVTAGYQSLFSSRGGVLTQIQTVGGDYIGLYECKGASDVQYNVQVPGASTVNAGAIVGIVFAVLFVIVLIMVGLWFAYKKGYFGGGGEDEGYDDGHDIDNDYGSAKPVYTTRQGLLNN